MDMNLPRKLGLKENAKYILTSSLDPKSGLINGTEVILRKMKLNQNVNSTLNDSDYLLVEPLIRNANTSKFQKGTIIPIWLVKKTIEARDHNDNPIKISRIQFPLVLGYAIVVQKGQGISADHLKLVI